MHQTGRGYRQDGHQDRLGTGYAALCIIAMLLPSLAWTQGQAERGQAIYTQYCTRCHGADGRGGPMVTMLPVRPRNLADRAYMQTRTAEQLFEVIKQGGNAQGLSPTMPGFGKQISDAQVRDTVAYIRTLAGPTSAARSQPEGTVPAEPPPSDLRIQRLSVSLWPEYDDPRVLVILRGELSPESQVPTRLRLPLPKGAELIGAGMISSQNELLNHPHERLAGDTSDTLELTLPVRGFFAEWYYDPFGQHEPARQFTYSLTLPYSVAQLDMDILQPDAATDFRITPAPMQEDVDTRGGKHHRFSYRDLEPETAQTVEVAYLKTTDEPSIAKSPDLSSNSPEDNLTPGSLQSTDLSRSTKTWVTFAMLVGFAIIFAGGVLLFRHKQPAAPPAAPVLPAVPAPDPTVTATRPVKVPETTRVGDRTVAPTETTVATPNYCSNCGRQLQATYVFCPGCGLKFRTS